MYTSTAPITNIPNPTAIWNYWNSPSASTVYVNTSSNIIWQNWSSGATSGNVIISPTQAQFKIQTQAVVKAPPKKAKAKVQAEWARYARIRKQEQHKREKPDRKAETLLLKHLNREQRLTWIKDKYFEFSVGPRRYRIKRGKYGNVSLLGNDGKSMIDYCCHPANDVPVPLADVAMSQWMMLLYNEDGFLKLANIHWRRPLSQVA